MGEGENKKLQIQIQKKERGTRYWGGGRGRVVVRKRRGEQKRKERGRGQVTVRGRHFYWFRTCNQKKCQQKISIGCEGRVSVQRLAYPPNPATPTQHTPTTKKNPLTHTTTKPPPHPRAQGLTVKANKESGRGY